MPDKRTFWERDDSSSEEYINESKKSNTKKRTPQTPMSPFHAFFTNFPQTEQMQHEQSKSLVDELYKNGVRSENIVNEIADYLNNNRITPIVTGLLLGHGETVLEHNIPASYKQKQIIYTAAPGDYAWANSASKRLTKKIIDNVGVTKSVENARTKNKETCETWKNIYNAKIEDLDMYKSIISNNYERDIVERKIRFNRKEKEEIVEMGERVQQYGVKSYKPNTKTDGCKLYPLPLVCGTTDHSDNQSPRLLIFFSFKKNVDELIKVKFYAMIYILYLLYFKESLEIPPTDVTNYNELFLYVFKALIRYSRYDDNQISHLLFFDTLFSLSPLRLLLLKINGKDINNNDVPFIEVSRERFVTVDISKIFNLLDTLISEQCLYNDRELTRDYLSQYTTIDPATRENSPGSTPDKMVVESPSAKGSSAKGSLETVFDLPKGGTRHRNKRSTRRTRRQKRTKKNIMR